MKINRQQPVFFVYQSIYNQIMFLKKHNKKQKLLCLETNRGRSVLRITRLSRSQHRTKLQNLITYGIKPSQW